MEVHRHLPKYGQCAQPTMCQGEAGKTAQEWGLTPTRDGTELSANPGMQETKCLSEYHTGSA